MFSYWNTTYYGQTQRHIFVRACERLAVTLLTGKLVKNPKTFLFLITCYAVLIAFLFFLKENNDFKLQLKEPLLISYDKSVLIKTLTRFLCNYLLNYFVIYLYSYSLFHYYLIPVSIFCKILYLFFITITICTIWSCF